ncbi:interleukin-17 receptor E, partial [Carettochelys insculpta]|uniref:interleukin-17 receptor E n=1 Tax=Carettochelys insculpta TaxID=44489 RepID=UPI003EB8B194
CLFSPPADSSLGRLRCQQQEQDEAALAPPALALSSAQLCQAPLECRPCVQVRLALRTAGLGSILGVQLHFLVLGSNRAGWLQVRRRRPEAAGGSLWQVQFECFPVERGRRVLVSLGTIPERGLRLSRSHVVPVEQADPKFGYTWLPATRAILVSVPLGPALGMRLCHQLALECEELPGPFGRQAVVAGGHSAVLPYERLLPCLCIEAAYLHHDSLRTKLCPFQDQPAAYGADLWASMQFHDYSGKSHMAMVLSARCSLRPTAMLCWRESEAGACHSIPNSTATESEQAYTVEKVDVHPLLCFQFSCGNSSHVECPSRAAAAWNVSVNVRAAHLVLRLTSAGPAAFSAALCRPRGSRCEPEGPVHTVTGPHSPGPGPGELSLLLPRRVLGSCLLVWRSDVRFARKQILCPDVARSRVGLVALGLALALVLLGTILLQRCRSLRRLAIGPRGRRPILLLCSPDSEEHQARVCALAGRLRSALGCSVRLGLWEAGSVGRLGALPWLYAQRQLVAREQGTVLLLWSSGSARLYRLWREAAAGSSGSADPHDLFGAAMSCLQSELQGAGPLGDWALAYFGELCPWHHVPPALRLLPCYCLPRELPGLARLLQGTARPRALLPKLLWLRHGPAPGLAARLGCVGPRPPAKPTLPAPS